MKKKVSKKITKAVRPTYHIVVFVAFLVALVIDQVTKNIASFSGNVSINPGVSFGLLSGPWLTVLLLVFFVAFFEWSCPRWHKQYPIASGFLLGGAMSNIVDRIVLNGVRDFMPIPLSSIQNNIADWFIVVALAYILFKSMGQKPPVSQKR